jgi:hypothetical protein
MKKKKFLDKRIGLILTLLILVLILVVKTNFLKNLINIFKFSESERIVKTYGFCRGESIGYLRYLKKKYRIKTNPKILNFVHTPPTNWSIYETNKNANKENRKILLNYPGKEIDINLAHHKDNFYELPDYYYYSNYFNDIKKLKIEKFNKENINIEFYIKDESNKFVMQKNLTAIKSNINNYYLLDEKLNNFKVEEKKFFLKFVNLEKETKIILTLRNKYDLDNYKILDKFKNCYFIE